MNTMISPFWWSTLRDTVLLPFALSLALGLGGRWLLGRLGVRPALRGVAGALALAGAFLFALHALNGAFAWPPAQALDWLPVLLGAGLALFAVDDWRALPAGWRVALQGLFALVAAGLLLLPLFEQDPGAAAALPLIGGVWFAVWFHVDGRAPREFGPPAALLIVAAGNAVVAVLTGSVLLGQLSGALAAALGAGLLAGLVRREPLLGHAGAAVGVIGLGGLLLAERYYAELPLSVLALLLSAFALSAAFSARRRREAWRLRDGLWAGVLAGVPVLLAAWLAYRFFMPPAGAY